MRLGAKCPSMAQWCPGKVSVNIWSTEVKEVSPQQVPEGTKRVWAVLWCFQHSVSSGVSDHDKPTWEDGSHQHKGALRLWCCWSQRSRGTRGDSALNTDVLTTSAAHEHCGILSVHDCVRLILELHAHWAVHSRSHSHTRGEQCSLHPSLLASVPSPS